MRLERLEINGFKSFSDRSELAFDKGVTAIVGPNGCGKSNVADAITWVMGEQSAKSLRGDRMEDVIFSGSDARKPTSAAEVRLRFSGVLTAAANGQETGRANGHANGHSNGHETNGHATNGHGTNGLAANGHEATGRAVLPEFPIVPDAADLISAGAEAIIQSVAREVEVTRRLYRSGESEYLIDGQVCRLRDVHDLLMDTGLGAKAYAIIEQGKIGLILSSRPTDRRQLIEEAAGITKYKARRRSAELKLEAAQQNLTRIDDIVFEVEKQRGVLKRQAARARRYQKLRDEQRRWEKVLFARKYRQLAETIESARTRLAEARERESAAAAALSTLDGDLARLRLELVEAEAAALAARESAHACEMSIAARQQQVALDKAQVETLAARSTSVRIEREQLETRREPAQTALAARRSAAAMAEAERDTAAAELASASGAYETAYREIEGLEADVEAARSEVFSALNSATALRHSMEHAASARDRVAETLSKLSVEDDDVRIQSERIATERQAAAESLRRAQDAIEATRIARAARESEHASARIEHEWRARTVRSGEAELAGLQARLASLEELDAARASFGDAARAVLAHANGKVNQRGAIADYLEVDPGYERAVEACLGDLLQHVIVERPEYAAAGIRLVREEHAGRCGFLVASETDSDGNGVFHTAPPEGLQSLSSVVRVSGPFAPVIRETLGDAWIADSYEQAASVSSAASVPVVTAAGELFRGTRLVSGGSPDESRGILENRRAIKDLRERIDRERHSLASLADETSALEATMAQASNALSALNAEHHRQEKAVVAFEAQARHLEEERQRLDHKREQLARERRQADEERASLDRRQLESRESITHLEAEQNEADERLAAAQLRLIDSREAAEGLSRRAGDARAAHAALVERSAALASDVLRLEEAAAEMEARAQALASELDESRARSETLAIAIQEGELALDEDVQWLDRLKAQVQSADESVAALRVRTAELEVEVKTARESLESVRELVASLDVTRATAEADLSHLAQACIDTVQVTLDDVLVEVAAREAAGDVMPDARLIASPEGDLDEAEATAEGPVDGVDGVGADRTVTEAEQRALSAEEAVSQLRAKIERLGPVNMMAIEQFDELESRHTFLVAQRADLVESIAQTTQAIKRIDETTRQRFAEAFTAINRNFQETFTTLFGGGRAGLTLLDENDPLESGIEIIAQPPGKRLQSVQLLSGGEKALTAISLMFGLFKYKPSPFCLLDEIDAPLDDANIGRFVEMLRAMQHHTQFILITHNRKTMEIADRLYGVTMEEPGVSKLISVQLN
ncbi:MAG: chromosome segregation protein SMC [Vicinamibacterales bacterium]